MYHYADGDVPRGPVPKEALAGRITAQTLVWRDGMTDWVPAGTLPELAEMFARAEPVVSSPMGSTVAAAVAPPVAAPVSSGADQWTGNTVSAVNAVSVPPPTAMMDYQTNLPSFGQPPGTAVASMVLGIVGIMLFCAWGFGLIPSILAVIFGYVARGQGASGNNPGAGMATAGIIMGWIPIGLAVVGVVLLILVMVVTAIASH